jgi:hypothetical protein
VGRLQRYFWPETALLFYLDEENIEAAFGYLEKGGVDIEERRTVPYAQRSEFVEWYKEIVRTYPKTYVGAMLDTFNQGALPGCGQRVFRDFGVDASLVHALCVDDRFTAYVSLVEMKWFEQKFKGVEFDFLFSPFVLLYRRSRPLLEETPGLFVLHQRGAAFLMVLSQDRMWYAHVLAISEEKEAPLEEEGEEDLAFDLDMIGEEDDVTPISDVDVLGEFKTEEKSSGVEDEAALEQLEYNLNFFEEIKEAIRRFYHDERYPQAFIEKVTLFDMDELGGDFVRYVEDELFMEATLHRFDPLETMASIVGEEVKS